MKRAVLSAAATTVALAVLPVTPAGAAHALSLPQATKVTGHVKRLERHNHFGLRARIGGAFQLGRTVCDPHYTHAATPRIVLCEYTATALAPVRPGFWEACTIGVTVRLHGLSRTTWKRVVEVCAESSIAPRQ